MWVLRSKESGVLQVGVPSREVVGNIMRKAIHGRCPKCEQERQSLEIMIESLKVEKAQLIDEMTYYKTIAEVKHGELASRLIAERVRHSDEEIRMACLIDRLERHLRAKETKEQ
jgi:hypothetical protein